MSSFVLKDVVLLLFSSALQYRRCESYSDVGVVSHRKVFFIFIFTCFNLELRGSRSRVF